MFNFKINQKTKIKNKEKSHKELIQEKNRELLKGMKIIEVNNIPEKFGKIEVKEGILSDNIRAYLNGIEISKLEDFIDLFNSLPKDPIFYYRFVYDNEEDTYIEMDMYFAELSDGRIINYYVILKVI